VKEPNELLLSQYMLQRKRFYDAKGWQELIDSLKNTTTLYVGNLSFYTTEEQIYELFSRCGEVRRVIMGLNKNSKTPCGFCFVEYADPSSASTAQRHVSGTKLDERIIKADLDPGFEDGRQWGRSHRNGGQIRDDYRVDYDPGRGGWSSKRDWENFKREEEKALTTPTIPEEPEKSEKSEQPEKPDDSRSSKRQKNADKKDGDDESKPAEADIEKEVGPNPRFRDSDEED